MLRPRAHQAVIAGVTATLTLVAFVMAGESIGDGLIFGGLLGLGVACLDVAARTPSIAQKMRRFGIIDQEPSVDAVDSGRLLLIAFLFGAILLAGACLFIYVAGR
jgi:hypothetical protein